LQTNTLFSDPESEISLLQALYLEPELTYQIDVKGKDFKTTEHRTIYETMVRLYADRIAPEVKTIKDASPSLNAMTVFKVFDGAVTAANAQYHARKLREVSFNRQAKESLNKLTETLGDDDFLMKAEQAIYSLYECQQRKQSQLVQETLGLIHRDIVKARTEEVYGIQTAFAKLNDACVGLCPRHCWVLGGYTSLGKSTLLSQIVKDISVRGAKTLIFSVEDSIQDKLIRLVATITGTPIKSIVRGLISDDVLRRAFEAISSYDLCIYDDVYSLEEMDLKIKKHKIQGGVDVVAIDFVQNIITPGESIYERMSEVAIKLQKMAKKHEVCILALSQITSDDKGKIALRGAQELASSADIVLWIDRKPDDSNFNLVIRKNRPFGQTGCIKMTFTALWTGIKENYGRSEDE
jgi:replicative DNA helicase